MNTFVILIILLISSVISISSVWVIAGEREEQCISLIEQCTAAIVARDWDNLERISKDRVKYCKGVEKTEDLSYGYADIAMANNNQGRPTLALDACESCIKTYYGNPRCHIEKSQALIKLGRKKEALDVLDIAEKLVDHNLKINERDLSNAYSSVDKEFYEAKKNNLETNLSYINFLRESISSYTLH